MPRPARALGPALVITATILLGLGIFGPCLKILPGFGGYSPVVRVLKPELTEPVRYSLFDGITHLARGGHWLLAAILFAFSIVFPLAKLSTYWVASLESPEHPWFRTAVKGAGHLGKFSMVDVFVIAWLVITIKGLPGTSQVFLQWGFWCFCGAILTSLIIPFAIIPRGRSRS